MLNTKIKDDENKKELSKVKTKIFCFLNDRGFKPVRLNAETVDVCGEKVWIESIYFEIFNSKVFLECCLLLESKNKEIKIVCNKADTLSYLSDGKGVLLYAHDVSVADREQNCLSLCKDLEELFSI